MLNKNIFPIWEDLSKEEQKLIIDNTININIKKNEPIYDKSKDCFGFFIIKTGQIRAYILSDEGKEVTVYRLKENDSCLLSASCIINSIQFEVFLETEKDTEILLIDSEIYKSLMNKSLVISKYTNEIMASRFSTVMWLMEQIMWKSIDKRLALFILEEMKLEGNRILKITHEKIANHLGTAREVVTRMLKYFQEENILILTRGSIEIIDIEKLKELIK